ncbi:MAG: hypothetical protein Q9211_003135 [Gyalolechia sp. 1 TL-2023]
MAQTSNESKYLVEKQLANPCRYPPGTDIEHMAGQIVKQRWIDQGIWKSTWSEKHHSPDQRWKHEESLEPEHESDPGSAELTGGIFADCRQPEPERVSGDEEKRQATPRRAERCAIHEREREASRPYHQFIYQVSIERQRIQDDAWPGELTGKATLDINTKAYAIVKHNWIRTQIWDRTWGVLPRTRWKHELAVEDLDGWPSHVSPAEGHEIAHGDQEEQEVRAQCTTSISTQHNSSNATASAPPLQFSSLGVQRYTKRTPPPALVLSLEGPPILFGHAAHSPAASEHTSLVGDGSGERETASSKLHADSRQELCSGSNRDDSPPPRRSSLFPDALDGSDHRYLPREVPAVPQVKPAELVATKSTNHSAQLTPSIFSSPQLGPAEGASLKSQTYRNSRTLCLETGNYSPEAIRRLDPVPPSRATKHSAPTDHGRRKKPKANPDPLMDDRLQPGADASQKGRRAAATPLRRSARIRQSESIVKSATQDLPPTKTRLAPRKAISGPLSVGPTKVEGITKRRSTTIWGRTRRPKQADAG